PGASSRLRRRIPAVLRHPRRRAGTARPSRWRIPGDSCASTASAPPRDRSKNQAGSPAPPASKAERAWHQGQRYLRSSVARAPSSEFFALSSSIIFLTRSPYCNPTLFGNKPQSENQYTGGCARHCKDVAVFRIECDRILARFVRRLDLPFAGGRL